MALYSEISLDSLSLVDSSNNIIKFNSQLYDSIEFIDNSFITDSYIKKTNNTFYLNDYSDIELDITSLFKEHLIFNDNSSSFLTLHQLYQDNLNIIDDCSGSVIWNETLIGTSILIINDSSQCIVSRETIKDYTSELLANVGTSEESLFTCITPKAQIINISLTNVISTIINVDIILYKEGITPFNVMSNIELSEGETFIINKNENCIISIEENDIIKVISSELSSLDAYIAISIQQ